MENIKSHTNNIALMARPKVAVKKVQLKRAEHLRQKANRYLQEIASKLNTIDNNSKPYLKGLSSYSQTDAKRYRTILTRSISSINNKVSMINNRHQLDKKPIDNDYFTNMKSYISNLSTQRQRVLRLQKALFIREGKSDFKFNTDAKLYFDNKKRNLINYMKHTEDFNEKLTEHYLKIMENQYTGVEKKIIGDSGINDESVKKINLTNYMKELHDKYSENGKEHIIIMGFGIYEKGEDGQLVRAIYPIFYKHMYMYKNLSNDDYIILLAFHNSTLNPSGYTDYGNGVYELNGIKNIVVLHGTETNINKIPLHKLSLLNKMLMDVNKTQVQLKEGFCLVELVIHTMQQNRNKTFSFDKFNEQLKELNIDINHLSSHNVIEWRNQYYPNISLYSVDALKNIIIHEPSTDKNHQFSICWINHDGHCYPITDETLCHGLAHDYSINYGITKYNISYEDGWIPLNADSIGSFIDGKSSGVFDDEDFDVKKVCVLSKCATNNNKIYDIATKVLNQGLSITKFQIHGNQMTSFVHPKTGQIIVVNDDLQERINVLKICHDEFKCEQFRFSGQSLTTIAITLFERLCGRLPKSSYNDYVRKCFDEFPTCAIVQQLTSEYVLENTKGFDIIKSYSNSLRTMDYNIPLFTIHDRIVKYDGSQLKCGFYYINTTKLPFYYGKEQLLIRRGFHSYQYVQYLIDNDYITTDDIKYMCVASHFIKGSIFKRFVEFTYNHFDSGSAKKLVNMFIGFLNTKYNKSQYATISSDDNTAFCLALNSMNDDKYKYNMSKVGNYYLITKTSEKRQLYDNSSIWTTVIDDGSINLLKLLKKAYGKNSKLVGINTDSVFIENPRKVDIVDRSVFEEEIKEKDMDGEEIIIKKTKDVNMLEYIGMYSNEVVKEKPFHPMKELMSKLGEYKYEYVESEFDGTITVGGGGCGKTYSLAKKMEQEIKKNPNLQFRCFSFTNKAVKNIKDTANKFIKSESTKNMIYKNTKTFNKQFKAFNDNETQMIKFLNSLDVVFIDEFIMTPNKFMTMVYHSKVLTHLYGDPNQLNAISEYYDYIDSPSINELCPNNRTLNYIDGCQRFDNELKGVAEMLLYNGIVGKETKPIDSTLFQNICYTNKKRVMVNTACCLKFSQGKDKYNIDCHFNDNGNMVIESYIICEKMPIIATQNIDGCKIINSNVYQIDKIDDEYIYINHTFKLKEEDVQFKLSHERFGYYFLPAFCCTTHKFQGSTIEGEYNIYETHLMDKKLIYTAITRGTKFSNIHSDISTKKVYKNIIPDNKEFSTEKGGKYANGKIYEIKFSNDKYYIGITTKSITQRFEKHKKDKHSPVFKFAQFNPSIKLLYNFPCFTKDELLNKETVEISRYINKYGMDNILNTQKVDKLPHSEIVRDDNTQVVKNDIDTASKIRQAIKKIDVNIRDDTKKQKYIISKMVEGTVKYKSMKYNEKNKGQVLEKMEKWRDENFNVY